MSMRCLITSSSIFPRQGKFEATRRLMETISYLPWGLHSGEFGSWLTPPHQVPELVQDLPGPDHHERHPNILAVGVLNVKLEVDLGVHEIMECYMLKGLGDATNYYYLSNHNPRYQIFTGLPTSNKCYHDDFIIMDDPWIFGSGADTSGLPHIPRHMGNIVDYRQNTSKNYLVALDNNKLGKNSFQS